MTLPYRYSHKDESFSRKELERQTQRKEASRDMAGMVRNHLLSPDTVKVV